MADSYSHKPCLMGFLNCSCEEKENHCDGVGARSAGKSRARFVPADFVVNIGVKSFACVSRDVVFSKLR